MRSRCFLAAGLPFALSGCGRPPLAPSVTIFGSYFPAWIICVLAGMICTLVVRGVFIRSGMDEYLPLRALVYVSLMVLVSIMCWFLAFGGVPQ